MDYGIKGRIALVTGGSKGIGRAVAGTLAAEGARVALNARGEAELDAAVEAIRLRGGEAFAFPGDVAGETGVTELVERVRERLGPPAILIANAGGPPPGTPTELDEAAWERGYRLTLMSTVRLVRETLPAMRRARWGRIVTITSLSVLEPIPNLTLSNAYRSAVTAWAKTLAGEVAADGVSVNNVAPGYTATERLEELFTTAGARERLIASIPAQRFATPDEIAAAAVFLCSEAAGYITGQTLLVDGGAVRANV